MVTWTESLRQFTAECISTPNTVAYYIIGITLTLSMISIGNSSSELAYRRRLACLAFPLVEHVAGNCAQWIISGENFGGRVTIPPLPLFLNRSTESDLCRSGHPLPVRVLAAVRVKYTIGESIVKTSLTHRGIFILAFRFAFPDDEDGTYAKVDSCEYNFRDNSSRYPYLGHI